MDEETCLDCEEQRKQIDALNDRIKELEEPCEDCASLQSKIDELESDLETANQEIERLKDIIQNAYDQM